MEIKADVKDSSLILLKQGAEAVSSVIIATYKSLFEKENNTILPLNLFCKPKLT